MKGVYRHVVILAGESFRQEWFAGDSVGNSGSATSQGNTRAVGQPLDNAVHFWCNAAFAAHIWFLEE